MVQLCPLPLPPLQAGTLKSACQEILSESTVHKTKARQGWNSITGCSSQWAQPQRSSQPVTSSILTFCHEKPWEHINLVPQITEDWTRSVLWDYRNYMASTGLTLFAWPLHTQEVLRACGKHHYLLWKVKNQSHTPCKTTPSIPS